MVVIVVFAVMFIFSILIIFWNSTSAVFSAESQIVYGIKEQKVHDQSLKVESVYDGLEYPTSMTFIGPGDILVTEKDKERYKGLLMEKSYHNQYLMRLLQMKTKGDC